MVERYARIKDGRIVCMPCAAKRSILMKIAAVSDDGVTIDVHPGDGTTRDENGADAIFRSV
jgi:hypothetical protein